MNANEVHQLICQYMENVWTASPAEITAVNEDKVSVKMNVGLRMTNGFVLDIPTLDGVPLMKIGCAAGTIKFSLSVGDPVILIFMSSDPSEWINKKDGNFSKASSITRNAMTYCVAIPMHRGGVESKGLIEFDSDGGVTINNHLKVTT